MKRLALIILLFATIFRTNAQVGIGTTSPDASSSLDINATDSGLLIPRVSLVNIANGSTPVNAPANSLLVYNTNPAITGGNGTGYYYWNGSVWTKLFTVADEKWSRNSTGQMFPANITDQIGLGNSNPSYLLDVAGRIRVRNGTHSAGIWFNNNTNTVETGFVGMDENNRIGFYGNTGGNWGLVMNTTSGHVGIANQNPNAPLQFSNGIANRKIVLYDTNNNDHQYYGFGINGGTLRYQTDAVAADHAFFAGINASTSAELVRIKGNGNVGIGVNPTQKLDIAGKIKITDGSQGVGKVLSSDANGVATWVNNIAVTPAVVGVFAGGGASFGNGTAVGVTTPMVYCNVYIDLPPGKWIVFGTYLISGTPTLTSGQSIFVRTALSASDTVNANPDVVSGALVSGTLIGPTVFGIANGQTIINNSGAAVKRYYLWGNLVKYGTTPTTFNLSGLGSNFWAENQLSAIPTN